jgi:3-deoxy-D-manno-octulosonic-acid transferase
MSAGLLAWRALAGLAHPLAPAWLSRRAAAGKEDPSRWREKLGRSEALRPPGALAWLHGASVGEALSLLPIAEALARRRPPPALLVTTGTLASAKVMAARLPAGALHQFAPLDTPQAVARFLERWRPDLAVFAESELWPNLVLAAKAAGARLALVSAKLSARSLSGWRRAPRAARRVLGAFDLVLARDAQAAAGLRSLGAHVDGLADLKFGAATLPVDETALAALTAARRGPLILAASTHPGEDGPILAAFAAARKGASGALVIAPRHVERGGAVADLARGLGLSAGLRSQGAGAGDVEVLVADTLGELGLWYRLADLAVVAGSLVAGVGGHNPLEPARLGCPFVSGPHVENWPLYDELAAAGATRLVTVPDLPALFGDALRPAKADLRAMACRAGDVVAVRDAEARAALPRILALLDR